MGEWRKTLTGTPYLVLFIILISISVGTASALITITLAGNVFVTGTLTAEKYFDNGNTQIGLDSSALGGIGNVANGEGTTVGGGISNTASSIKSTVGGGNDNIASQGQSTIGGGAFNEASGLASTIGGGAFNDATGELSTVGGGSGNIAMGLKSTVAGGAGNQAIGDYSFAAGRLAIANHDGSIVFADSTAANFESTAVDQFSIRAANGLRLVGPLDCNGCVDSDDIGSNQVKSLQISAGAVGTSEIAENAVTGSEIDGISKLFFGECTATFTNVISGASTSAGCPLNGFNSGDNIIVLDNPSIANCFVVGGVGTALDNLPVILANNLCGSDVVSQTVTYSVIVFRVT